MLQPTRGKKVIEKDAGSNNYIVLGTSQCEIWTFSSIPIVQCNSVQNQLGPE